MDCSLPGSFVHGILQARILEWVSMPSSRESSRPRDRTCISYISCIGRWFFTTSTTNNLVSSWKFIAWMNVEWNHFEWIWCIIVSQLDETSRSLDEARKINTVDQGLTIQLSRYKAKDRASRKIWSLLVKSLIKGRSQEVGETSRRRGIPELREKRFKKERNCRSSIRLGIFI